MKMFKNLMISAVLLGTVFSSNSFAETILCDKVEIKQIFAIGERDDSVSGATQENKLLVEPVTQCGDKVYFYIPFNSPSYSSMLTLILNAQNSGKTLKVLLNTNDATEKTSHSNRILWVSIY
ncbi:MAG: hypothetical protein OCD01_05055 [Fibrobacterales bacterium]